MKYKLKDKIMAENFNTTQGDTVPYGSWTDAITGEHEYYDVEGKIYPNKKDIDKKQAELKIKFKDI